MTLDFLKGPEIEDQYKNIIYFDRGGMGEIHLATDIKTSKQVAIKIIRIDNEGLENLLNEEFRIALNLNHQNIIKTYYYGKFHDPTGNYFYSVMEFSKNGSLRKKLISSTEVPSFDEAVEYFYNLSHGIQEAHKIIIHRDIKPENILISDDGKLKICDFGIAKYVNSITRTKTFKGSGSFPYMSPECWVGDPNTKSMDIYSLGIVFFEILTLKRPFDGESEREIRSQHLFKPIPSIIELRKDVPILISEIIRKMTNKNVNHRYQSIDEVIADLDNSFQLKEEKQDKVQSVLVKVHRKLNSIKEEELKRQKEKEEYLEEQNWLQFAINELFDSIITIGEQINKSLIEEKITFNKSGGTNAEGGRLSLRVFDKSMTIFFYNRSIISEFIVGSREKTIQKQIQHYGHVMEQPGHTYTQTDNLILLGKIETNSFVYDKSFGVNLILRKHKPDDIYGEWWLCKFEDSMLYSKPTPHVYYFIEPMEFFTEYEIGRRNAMHIREMKFKKLDESDIVDLIGQLVE
jgi:serine/threonine protein kinase